MLVDQRACLLIPYFKTLSCENTSAWGEYIRFVFDLTSSFILPPLDGHTSGPPSLPGEEPLEWRASLPQRPVLTLGPDIWRDITIISFIQWQYVKDRHIGQSVTTHPQCRPITSRTNVRWWLEEVQKIYNETKHFAACQDLREQVQARSHAKDAWMGLG